MQHKYIPFFSPLPLHLPCCYLCWKILPLGPGRPSSGFRTSRMPPTHTHTAFPALQGGSVSLSLPLGPTLKNSHLTGPRERHILAWRVPPSPCWAGGGSPWRREASAVLPGRLETLPRGLSSGLNRLHPASSRCLAARSPCVRRLPGALTPWGAQCESAGPLGPTSPSSARTRPALATALMARLHSPLR